VACDYFGVDYLSLFLEKFVLGYLFQTLSDINQLGVELIDFTLLCEFEKMSLVVGIEINRDGLVSSISRDETDVETAISTDFSLVIISREANGYALDLVDDVDLRFCWFLSCDFVEKFDGFAWFGFNVKAKRFCSDSKVEGVGRECQHGQK